MENNLLSLLTAAAVDGGVYVCTNTNLPHSFSTLLHYAVPREVEQGDVWILSTSQDSAEHMDKERGRGRERGVQWLNKQKECDHVCVLTQIKN